MFKNILKLVWNRKKNNLLLVIEMFFSFLVIFAVSGLVTTSVKNYYSPLGFDYRNIITVKIYSQDSLDFDAVDNLLSDIPEVKGIGSADSPPYDYSKLTANTKYKNIDVPNVSMNEQDYNYAGIMNIKLEAGRWFKRSDEVSSYRTVVINRELKELLFGNENPLGKIIHTGYGESVVTGVLNDYRKFGEFSEPEPICITGFKWNKYQNGKSYVLKVNSSSERMLQDRIIKLINMACPGAFIQVENLEERREEFLDPDYRQLIVFITIGTFLILNVALGLFGVLWYSVNMRKQEIGIRRAVGADKRRVYLQITGETIFITSFSILIGLLFAVQLPAVNLFNVESGIYIMAVIISVLFIYFVVSVCSAYPGYLASKIEPVAALHEE